MCAFMGTLAKAVAVQGGDGSVSTNVIWSRSTAPSWSFMLEMAPGWRLSRENYAGMCPALYVVMVSGRRTDLDRSRDLAVVYGNRECLRVTWVRVRVKVRVRVRGAFQRQRCPGPNLMPQRFRL